MSDLPDDLRRQILIEVYRQAADLNWDGMTTRERTTQYNQWLESPLIGGQLSRFMEKGQVRTWLKDIAMKEYSRAKFGIGLYAPYVSVRFTGPDQIAKQVMGPEWSMLEHSVREKPNRCVIAADANRRLMMWGPPPTLRDMIWAGINVIADGREPEPLIVITAQQGEELNAGEKRRHVQLGKIAGLEVAHTTLRTTRVDPAP